MTIMIAGGAGFIIGGKFLLAWLADQSEISANGESAENNKAGRVDND